MKFAYHPILTNKVYKLIVPIYFALMASMGEVWGQVNCGDVSFGGSSSFPFRQEGAAGLGRFCAPVVVDAAPFIQATISGLAVGDVIEIQIDWGDGSPLSNYPAQQWASDPSYWVLDMDGHPEQGNAFALSPDDDLNVRKTYGTGEDVCEFIVTARLFVNGNLCGTPQQITVNYWDLDDQLPGNPQVAPDRFLVCAGDAVIVDFDDNSIFNCTDPADSQDPNDEVRHIRWIYNSKQEAAPNGRINNVELEDGKLIDQGNAGDENYIPSNGPFGNGVFVYDEPVSNVSADGQTIEIEVPETANVGEIFEVEYQLWGPCNPYDEAVPANSATPIIRRVIIEIVEPPTGLSFTISTNGDGTGAKSIYCPGEDIRFRGDATNHTGDFRYSWRIYDGPNDTDGLVGTRNNDRNTWLSDMGDIDNFFSTPGIKLVRMIVENTDNDLTGNCETIFDQTIEIIETPQADIQVEDNDGVVALPGDLTLRFCEDELPVNLSFFDVSTGKTIQTDTEWRLLDNGDINITPDENDPSIEVGSNLLQSASIAAFNPTGLQNYEFSTPGHYKLRLRVEDGTTNCFTDQIVNIIIYRNPEAVFSFNESCAGNSNANRTNFNSISSITEGITPVIDNDEIDLWEWDFNFDGTTPNYAYTRTNGNNFNRFLDGTNGGAGGGGTAVAGEYKVLLRVTTASGCIDTTSQLVRVFFNPNAELDSDYIDPICPGSSIDFTNVTDESLNDASVINVNYSLRVFNTDDASTNTFVIGAPGSANETVDLTFLNSTGSIITYEVYLDAEDDNSCINSFGPISIDVLGAPPSNFNIFEEATFTVPYDNTNDYCSPYEFYYLIDNNTDALLDIGDSLVWTVTDGGSIIGGDTTYFGDPNYDEFSFLYQNDFPNTSFKTYLVTLQPYVDGSCVAPSAKEVRILPKPIADFTLVSVNEQCEDVTYRFEAVQKGLTVYDWSTNPPATTTTTNMAGDIVDFVFDRPEIGDPDLNFDVDLQTSNPFLCNSDVETTNYTIDAKENFTVLLVASPDPITADNCNPFTYEFSNGTTDAYPPSTTWILEIQKEDNFGALAPYEIIDGADLAGNEAFITPIQYEFDEAGEYRIELVATPPSNCAVPSTPPLDLTIHPVPEADFTISPSVDEICSPTEFTFINNSTTNGATITDYDWTITNTSTATDIHTASGNSFVYTLENTSDPIITFDITLKLTTDQACEHEITKSIDIWQKPAVDFTINPQVACEDEDPQEYTFEFNPDIVLRDNNPAGTEYVWFWGNGQSQDVGTNLDVIDYTYENAGNFFNPINFNVRLQATTPNGCVTDIQYPVTLEPRVIADYVFSTDEGCAPLNVNFNFSGQGPGGREYSYQYKLSSQADTEYQDLDTNPTNANAAHIFTNNSGGTLVYDVRLILSNNANVFCSDEVVKQITVYPTYQSASFSGPTEVCNGAQGVIFTVDSPDANSTYQWTVPSGAFIANGQGTDQIEVNFGNQDGDITLMETNGDGCEGSARSLAITTLLGPSVQMSIDSNTPICYGQSKTFIFDLDGPVGNNFDVTINVGGTDTTLQNINDGHQATLTFIEPTSVNIVNVVDLDRPTCSPSQLQGNFFVNVRPEVTAETDGSTLVCEGESVFIPLTFTGRRPWEVTIEDTQGNTFTETFQSAFAQMEITPTESTTYSIVSIIDTANNNAQSCSGTGSGTYEVTVSPSFNTNAIQGPVEVCRFAQDVAFEVEAVGPNSSFEWTLPSGAFISSNDPSANAITISFTTNDALISVKEINEDGCEAASAQLQVAILDQPNIRLFMDDTDAICYGESKTFRFEINGTRSSSNLYDVVISINGEDTTLVDVQTDANNEYLLTLDNFEFSQNVRVVSVLDKSSPSCDLAFGTDSRNVIVRQEVSASVDFDAIACEGSEVRIPFSFTGRSPFEVVLEDELSGNQTSFIATSLFYQYTEVFTTSKRYKIVSVQDKSDDPSISCFGNGSGLANVEVSADFSTPAISGESEVCRFQENVLFSVPDNPTSTYQWSVPSGAFVVDGQGTSEALVNFGTSGGNIAVKEINEYGCEGEESLFAVTVLDGATVQMVLVGPQTVCVGDFTQFQFNISSPKGGPYDVIWLKGGEEDTLRSITNGHVEEVQVLSPNSFLVLDVIDLARPDCAAGSVQGNRFINTYPEVTAALSGETAICEGNNATITANFSGQGPWDFVIEDDFGNQQALTATSSFYNFQVSPAQSTNYRIIQATGANCEADPSNIVGEAQVVVNERPEVVLSGNQTVCSGEEVMIFFSLQGEGPWTIRYTNGTNNFTISGIEPPAGYNPANDTYLYEHQVFPNTGQTLYEVIEIRDNNQPQCTGSFSGSALVTVRPQSQAFLSENTTICIGEQANLTLNLDGVEPFRVVYTDGNQNFEIPSANDGDQIEILPSENTVYRLVEAYDAFDCPVTIFGDPVNVTVNPLPTATISGDDTICYGESFTINFQMTGIGPWTVRYRDSSGEEYEFTTAFNSVNRTHNPTTDLSYEIISVADNNNPVCTNTSGEGVAQVNVYPELIASFTATPLDMTLPESTVQLVNETTNQSAWDFSWDFGDGNTFEGANPGSYEYGFYGEYTIRMTATNGQCTATFEQFININAIPPIVDFQADIVEGCNPLTVQFENLTQFAQPGTYVWEFGDGQRSTLDNPTHTFVKRTNDASETFTVTLSATNLTGQRITERKEAYITVYATPSANFSIPPNLRQTFTATPIQFINLSEGADDFQWDFGDGNVSFDREPIHSYSDSGVFDITLVAINSQTACTDTIRLDAQIKVDLGGESFVPNAFTPSRAGPGTGSNNPQSNDLFMPELKGVRSFNMKIYNRWGELLYETEDRDRGWDGYFKGQLMPQDVYVYRLDLIYENGRRETKIGDLTLIR